MKKFLKTLSLCVAMLVLLCSCAVSNPNGSIKEMGEIGTGNTSFSFTATLKDGNGLHYTVKTDKATVGEALSELGIISGDESQYGLYIKTVCGQTLDFNTDGYYWAFYENGNYAVSGVDTTTIDPTVKYELRAQK